MIDLNLTLAERLQDKPEIKIFEAITETLAIAFGAIAFIVLGVLIWAIM